MCYIITYTLAYKQICYMCSCFHSEMDITPVFGTVVPGSNPGGSTIRPHPDLPKIWGGATHRPLHFVGLPEGSIKYKDRPLP